MDDSMDFNVVDEVVVGDLTDVKQQKDLIPPTKNVKFRVKKVGNWASKDNTYRQLDLQAQIVDGVDEEGKYRNKIVFTRVCYYADKEKYTKDYFKNNQHLVALKQFLNAIEIDLSNVKINDEFFGSVLGREFIADIAVTTPKDGYDPSNELRNYKKVSVEDGV